MTTSNLGPTAGLLPIIFAAATYEKDPSTFLQGYPQASGWNIVWASDPSQPNYAFIGTDGTDYIAAIRGSEFSFTKAAFVNWFDEDLDVFKQEAWNWFVPASQSNNYGGAVLAKGSMATLNALLALADVSTGILFQDYLITNASNNNANISITGHSLGGNAVTVFAPYMQWYINNNANSNHNADDAVYPYMQAFTYAAPAAGNTDFAVYYDTLYDSSNQWYRFCNTNDIAPSFPQGLKETVAKMYSNGPDASQISTTILGKTVTLSGFFDTTQIAIDTDMLLQGYGFYTQPNIATGTDIFTNPLTPAYLANSLEDFLKQAGSQHDHNVYLGYFTGIANKEQASS